LRKRLAWLLALSLGVPVWAAAETTNSLLQQALKLTAEGKLPEAEQTYQLLSAEAPADGFAALARFLSRTGRTTESAALLQRPEVASLSPLAQGRIAVQARQLSAAVSLLQKPPSAGEEYEQALLLANTLQQLKRSEDAASALAASLKQPALAPMERRDLFQKIVRTGSFAKLQEMLPTVIGDLTSTAAIAYPTLREMAVDALNALALNDEYGQFQERATKEKDNSPAHGWIYALVAVKRGDVAGARGQLETLTTATLTPGQRAVIDEELARMLQNDPERQLSMYENLVTVAPDSGRLRVTVANMFFRLRRYDKARQLLEPVRPEALGEAELQIYKNVKIALGAVSPAAETIATFEKESKGLSYERIREVAQAPLVPLTRQQLETLSSAINKRLQDANAPSELYILEMSVQNALGNEASMLAALQEFVNRNPGNMLAATELAGAHAQQAYQLATADPSTSPPEDKLKAAADRAAGSLWRLIEARPYIPEPYEQLMELYKLYGQPEKARQVPHYLTKSTTATAEELHLAAYILATNGFPEDAVPVYERALKLTPENAHFRLNYAGALSRVGKLREADAIYRDIIAKGVNGRQYHAHDVYVNGLKLAQTHGYQEEYLAFLKSLIHKEDVPQHDYFLEEAGRSLLGSGLASEALPFFEALEVKYPERAWDARELIVHCHLEMKNFAKADQVLVTSEEKSTDTLGVILARSNRAVLRLRNGDIAGAVQQWNSIANEFPGNRQASRALLNAGQALVEAGRFSEAEQVLRRYLGLNAGDPDGEVSARELLTRVEKLDVPSETLVKSALEDAAAPPKP